MMDEMPFKKKFALVCRRDKYLYLLMLLPFLYYVVFCYVPMYGVLVAFKEIRVFRGIGSIFTAQNAGLKYFKQFLEDPYFYKLIRNTVLIQVYSIIWSFPAPVIFALMLNEVRAGRYKKFIQTATYLPHFISVVVVCGMIRSFLSTDGILNSAITALGGTPVQFLVKQELFRAIYISSGVWQSFGWGSIIYLAALTAINPELYEAAMIDGAGKLRRIWHISLPGITPTISILLIMRLGQIITVGHEKIMLLYNGVTMEVADVISTFVYRRGIVESNFNYGTAVGLFTSIIGFGFLVGANSLSKKLQETSLW